MDAAVVLLRADCPACDGAHVPQVRIAPRSIFEALHDATPGLTGAERLALFLDWPPAAQLAAWSELAEQMAARWLCAR